MFGDLIYYNKEKIDQYSSLILGKSIGKNEENSNSKITDYLLQCSEFEKILQNRDDYFDLVGTQTDVSIQDIRLASIIRVTGEIYVPEQFDISYVLDELIYKHL